MNFGNALNELRFASGFVHGTTPDDSRELYEEMAALGWLRRDEDGMYHCTDLGRVVLDAQDGDNSRKMAQFRDQFNSRAYAPEWSI